MTRRRGAAALAGLGLLVASVAGCERRTQPNVLLYVVDTLRADAIGPGGNETVDTPALDRLAREGAVFENAYAQASWTRPSIASILTGRYPEAHGVLHRRTRLAEQLTCLPELFRAHGYATAAIITNPYVASGFGFEQGFDAFVEIYAETPIGAEKRLTPSDVVTRRAIEWIDGVAGPFLLFVLTIDPHAPYRPPERFDRYGGDYSGPVLGNFDWLHRDDLTPSDKQRIRSLYDGEVAFNDDSFGRLLDHLRERRIYDDTIVVFTSDHGEEFWEHGDRGHGETLFDEVLRIPLLLRYPSAFPGGLRVTRAVESVDILPTLLSLAGLPPPDGVDGRALHDAAPTEQPRAAYASLEFIERQRAIRIPPYKLIWDRRSDTWRLFDLSSDPGEAVELGAKRPGLAAVLTGRMREIVANAEGRAPDSAASAPTAPLAEDARAALEAMGYVRGGTADAPSADPGQ